MIDRIRMIPGKAALSDLNRELQSENIGTVTITMLIDQMQIEDDYDDLKEILGAMNDFCLH